MKTRAPRPLGALLPGAFPQLAERLVEYRLRRAWPALVGAEVARRAAPRALVGGCLTVTVDNSPWLHELTLRADELLARVQAGFPAVGARPRPLGALPGPEPAPAPAAGPTTSTAPLDATARREIEDAVAAIADPELATAARRLLSRAWRAAGPRGTR